MAQQTISVIQQAISMIVDGSIVSYRHDKKRERICSKSQFVRFEKMNKREKDQTTIPCEKPFHVSELLQVEKNVIFLRVEIDDMLRILSHIFNTISSKSWITKFEDPMTRASYIERLNKTISDLAIKIKEENPEKITDITGEKVVSELGRQAIVDSLNYKDIPLGDVFKQAATGNGGFDMFSENHQHEPLFGEAKYLCGRNAYGSAFSQIETFIKEERAVSDYVDVKDFFSEEAKKKMASGERGYIAAFSSTGTATKILLRNIKENQHYSWICIMGTEIVIVAVNIKG